MNVRNFVFLCLIFAVVKCQSSDEDPVGTDCYTRQTHDNGTCQHKDDCPGATSGATYCNRRQGLVCCPNRDKDLEPPEPPQDLNIQRISDRKCKEYRKLTQKEIYIGSLVLNKPGKVVIADKCQHKSVGLIVGGVSAGASEFPHQALLGYQPRPNREAVWSCGGSLVSENFVLTATHCLSDKSTGHVKFVKLGMLRRSQTGNKVLIFNVDKEYPHPQYNPITKINDIGLIKMKGSVNFNEHIYPICLPTSQLEKNDGIVSGFGRTGMNDEQSQNLLKVILDRFTHDECQSLLRNQRIDRKTMLCYGSRKERKDSCRGDSGGPLQVSNNDEVRCTYKLIGIVNFGASQCGTPGIPSVYGNVFHYIDWIEGIVWENEVNVYGK